MRIAPPVSHEAVSTRPSFSFLTAPRYNGATLPILFGLGALALWELACLVFSIPAITVPAPSDIGQMLYRGQNVLLAHAMATLSEAAVGFVLAVLLGFVLAIAIVMYRPIKDAVFPNLVLLQFTPKIALAPLFIVWFGIESESRLAFATFMGFFPVMISTITGLSNTPEHLIRFSRSLRASDWQIFRTIRLPIALPYIFNGMKIAVSMALIGIVVGEFITSQRGLGYLILLASSKADTTLIFASVVCLSLGGIAMFSTVAAIEKILLSRFRQL